MGHRAEHHGERVGVAIRARANIGEMSGYLMISYHLSTSSYINSLILLVSKFRRNDWGLLGLHLNKVQVR